MMGRACLIGLCACDGPLQQQAGPSGCADLTSAATSDPEVQRPSTNPHPHPGQEAQRKHVRAMPRLHKRDVLDSTGADVWDRGSQSVAAEKEEDQEDSDTGRTEDPTGHLPAAWIHEPAAR
ncbi:hypothetical protein NDU88_005790 [Pleurodeles waltl]|uniref:Secreted protein n=1 Tax=Pleurodeles waltl TaxID=8319 RepID=A0AAV7MCA4_PLEWA|nr:hypothetical protein NDU88_005790 [Pleurodeles waltl]